MKCVVFSLALLYFFASPNANAQGAPPADVTEYTFNDEIVDGDLLRPDEAFISHRKLGASRSLVKVRTHFVPELCKSVSDI